MMYLHFCKKCNRIHMLNGHKQSCPGCTLPLKELQMPYMDYVHMDRKQRQAFLAMCNDDNSLNEISTTYRMYKYCKWYRNLQLNE